MSDRAQVRGLSVNNIAGGGSQGLRIGILRSGTAGLVRTTASLASGKSLAGLSVQVSTMGDYRKTVTLDQNGEATVPLYIIGKVPASVYALSGRPTHRISQESKHPVCSYSLLILL